MKKYYIFFIFLSIILSLLYNCKNKEWDEHYNLENKLLPDKTLKELISENPELKIFNLLLIKTGYADVLNTSQSYTVWAPVNEALIDIDTNNIDLIKKIVTNHIARSKITTSGLISKIIRMLNGKYIDFIIEGVDYFFGNCKILNSNIPAKNGLLHIVDGYVPYKENIWEYIMNKNGLDSLKAYLLSQNKYIFDPINSIEIGVDSNGNVIYDSALIYTNVFLDKVGKINNEDSVYTAILLNNNAWTEAYNKIKKYYNFPENAGSIIRQRNLTCYTIVKDILFRGKFFNYENYDTLISTTGTKFYNPLYLFNDDPINLSNGIAYVVSNFLFSDTISWFKRIKVEAENTIGRTHSGCNVFLRNSYGTAFNVSNNRYILVDPISTEPKVEFSIPNVLSAKYNIYCVFVPGLIVDSSYALPTKVRFKLTFIRRSNGSTFVTYLNPTNNITNPYAITKMLAGTFNFEYANVIDEEFPNVAVKLEVINIVSTSEEQSGSFTRSMRIDYIIFEPVLN